MFFNKSRLRNFSFLKVSNSKKCYPIFFQIKISWKSEQNNNFKRCNVCAQDIRRSCFALYVKTKNHLHKTGDKIGCEIWKLVISSGPAFQHSFAY